MSAAEQLPEADEAPERPHLEVVPEPRPMTVLLADLRTYLPTRTDLAVPFTGVGAGIRVLIGRGWTWISADGWIWEGWTKVGALVGGVYFGLPVAWHTVEGIAGPYAAFVPTVACVGGCIAARRFAPDEAKKKTNKAKPKPEAAVDIEDDDEPEYLDEDAAEVFDVEDVAALIRTVAARQKHQGAHLDDLLAEDLFEGWEKPELKAALTDDWGLPVESFKLIFQTAEGKRQRNREGVRLRHLPPAPARGAGEGPVRGLALVPSQPAGGPPASTPPEPPVTTPSGAPVEAPFEAAVEAAVGPSPTAPAPPSQGTQ